MSGLPSLAELAAGFLAGRVLAHRLAFRFGDCRLRLETDSAGLAHALRDYFGPFVQPGSADAPCEVVVRALEGPPPSLGLPLMEKEPEPGKSKIKEEFIDLAGGRLVRKRLTGMVFLLGGEVNLALGPCLENDNQVVNFINSRYIQFMLERGHLLCHAAAVANDGAAGLALAGFSGAGKSTLALHMMDLGLDFVSNDRLLIRLDEGGPVMHGVAKLPRINPGTALHAPRLAGILSPDEARRFAALAPAELWALESKHDVHLERFYGPGRFKLSALLRALVVLTWRQGNGPWRLHQADPARRVELLGAFIKSPGLFFLPGDGQEFQPGASAYLRDLAGCPVYELAGGADFPAAARACAELLTGEGHGPAGRV